MGFVCKPRSAAFVVLAGALLLGVGATTTPAKAADPYPTLRETNVVHTSTSGVATVRLTDPLTIDFKKLFSAPPPLEGAGRLTAMVLEKGGTPYLAAGLPGDCSAPGCTGSGSWFAFPRVYKRHLDPGVYHLYVVADGAPVTATLSLPGLGGRTDLTVTPDADIVAHDFAALLPSTGAGMDPAVYTANAGGTIGAQGGMLISQSYITTSNFVGAYYRHCATAGPPPVAYLPGCSLPPGTGTVSELSDPYTACHLPFGCDPQWASFEAQNGVPYGDVDLAITRVPAASAGQWSQGVYYQGAAVVTSASSMGVWLSYAAADSAPKPVVMATSSATASASPSATPTPTPAATPTPAPATTIGLPNTSSGASGGPGGALTMAGVAGLLLAWRRRPRHTRGAVLQE